MMIFRNNPYLPLLDLQPLAVAKLLKALVDKEQPQLIFLGIQAIDDDGNQTGQMLAAYGIVGDLFEVDPELLKQLG